MTIIDIEKEIAALPTESSVDSADLRFNTSFYKIISAMTFNEDIDLKSELINLENAMVSSEGVVPQEIKSIYYSAMMLEYDYLLRNLDRKTMFFELKTKNEKLGMLLALINLKFS